MPGDFNIKSKNWYINDEIIPEGTKIEFVHQIINELTHVLENSLYCIELIFRLQPNLVVDSDVHPSLHPNIKLCMENLT